MKFTGRLLLAVALASSGFARADQPTGAVEGEPGNAPVFRISVELVQVDAVVTDKEGRLVTDLGPADFTILDGGRPQQIANVTFVDAGALAPTVSEDSPQHLWAPRTVVLVFDDLGLSFFGAAEARSALQTFASEAFAPGDHVALVRTGQDEKTYTFFGSNEELSSAVSKLRYDLRTGGLGLSPAMLGDGYARRVAMIVGIIDGLRWLPGRKAVVLLSEGFDVSDWAFRRHGLHSAYDTLFSDNDEFLAKTRLVAEVANRASVVLYAVDPQGVGGDWLMQGTLYDLAHPTGGFTVVNHNDLAAGLRQIVADQAGYYLIGYEPPSSTFERKSGKPGFHRVKVKVDRPGLMVRSRAGFYGLTDAEVAKRAPRPLASN